MHNKEIIEGVMTRIIESQPVLFRRKDTIVTFLTGLSWLVAFVAPYVGVLPPWVAVIVGGVGTALGMLINAFTKAAITPSMVERVTEQVYEPDELPVFNHAASKS